MKNAESSCPNCGTNIKIFDKETRCPICDSYVFFEEKSGEISTDKIINTYVTKSDNRFLYLMGICVIFVSLIFFVKTLVVDLKLFNMDKPPVEKVKALNERPTSDFMIAFCEDAFKKPIEKITQEDYDKLKEWSIHYSPERQDFKIVYSFDKHDYRTMRLRPANIEHDRIPLYDFQVFRNLEVLNFEESRDFIAPEQDENSDYNCDLKNLKKLRVLRGSYQLMIENIPDIVDKPQNLTFISGSVSDGNKLYESAKKMEHIRDLKLHDVDVKAMKYLKFLVKFKRLKNLEAVALSDNTYLANLVHLKSLTIKQACNDHDYSELSALTELQSLTLETAVGIENIDFAANLPQLQHFSIDNSDIKDIRVLRGKALKSLTLVSNNKLQNYSPISDFSDLEELHVTRKNDALLVKFPRLGALKNLRSLIISSFWVNKIGNPPKLDDLSVITQLASDFYIDDISHLNRLKNLNLSGGGYIKHSHKFLDMTELRRLEFQNVRLMFMNLAHVFNHKNLYSVSFDKIQSYTLDFERMEENHNLRNLYFEEADTLYEMVVENTQNEGIRAADLPETPDDILKYGIPVVGINTVQHHFCDRVGFLTKLKGLKNLTLKNANLNDIHFIYRIPQLEYVDISSNNVSDISIFHSLHNLNTLLLYGNPVEDLEGLELKADVFM